MQEDITADLTDLTSHDLTRLASEAELKDLRQLREAKPRRRRVFFGVVVTALVAFIGALAFYALSLVEPTITWPGELDGNFHDGRKVVRVASDAALLVFWPIAESTKVSGDGTNVIDVVTALGRRYDVPMHLKFTQEALTNGWSVTSAESFSEWKHKRTLEGWAFDVASENEIFLNEFESGYPARSIDYYRGGSAGRVAGRALYLRHGPREIVLLREIPAEERGRADNVLNGYKCLAANDDASHVRFEIPEVRSTRKVDEILEDAYTEVMSGFLSADWRQLDLELRSAIIAAEEAGDESTIRRAKRLYSVFRTRVQHWYVRQCLEFNELGRDESGSTQNEKTKANRRTAIRRETAERLPVQSDLRQRRVAKDDWRVL